MSDRTKKILRASLKKELLIAIAAMVSAPGKTEVKAAPAPEARIETHFTPEENMEPTAEFSSNGRSEDDFNDRRFRYDRRLSRGLSIRYTGAYVDDRTGEVICKSSSPYEEDYHSTIKAMVESQKNHTNVYDCSGDKQIRRDMIRDGEYRRGTIIREVVQEGVHWLQLRNRGGR